MKSVSASKKKDVVQGGSHCHRDEYFKLKANVFSRPPKAKALHVRTVPVGPLNTTATRVASPRQISEFELKKNEAHCSKQETAAGKLQCHICQDQQAQSVPPKIALHQRCEYSLAIRGLRERRNTLTQAVTQSAIVGVSELCWGCLVGGRIRVRGLVTRDRSCFAAHSCSRIFIRSVSASNLVAMQAHSTGEENRNTVDITRSMTSVALMCDEKRMQ
ncbi:hypothetical protein MRX96_036799 [Rhipicephalus microplus]